MNRKTRPAGRTFPQPAVQEAAVVEVVEPSHIVLATRPRDSDGLVAAFRTYARAQPTGLDPTAPPSRAVE
jgi:hypothetical protein